MLNCEALSPASAPRLRPRLPKAWKRAKARFGRRSEKKASGDGGADPVASRLWNDFVARWRCLGAAHPVDAQTRYAVHDRQDRPVAMPAFAAAACRTAPRDSLIGWSPEARVRNLQRMVCGSRFLILPWIRIPNPGSRVLALARRHAGLDWRGRYAVEPILMEAFAEIPSFSGGRTGKESSADERQPTKAVTPRPNAYEKTTGLICWNRKRLRSRQKRGWLQRSGPHHSFGRNSGARISLRNSGNASKTVPS